ncbi:hypothetical protein IKZ77_01080 [Candidatus Saccharibacteria bacterium]|nr:hypothetical protein [Candidatus Saccharibacteria bacterium]
MQHNKRYLLANLRKLSHELGGRAPTMREVDACQYCPPSYTYKNVFGSFNAAIETLALKPNPQHRQRKSDEEMLSDLNKLCEELDRVPSKIDIIECTYCQCYDSYCRRFGGLRNALKLIGRIESKDEMLADLRKLAQELGKTPTTNDVQQSEVCPSIHRYYKMFGSWNNALRMAGLPLNNTTRIKK